MLYSVAIIDTPRDANEVEYYSALCLQDFTVGSVKEALAQMLARLTANECKNILYEQHDWFAHNPQYREDAIRVLTDILHQANPENYVEHYEDPANDIAGVIVTLYE